MKSKITILIIIVGLIIGGISYWFQPYNEMTIFGSNIYLIWSIGAFLGALFLMIIFKKMPVQISLFLTLGVVIAVLLRIIYDTTFWDSTSHNLAGIEIILRKFIFIKSPDLIFSHGKLSVQVRHEL